MLKISLHKDSIYVHDVMDFQPTDSVFAQVKKNSLMYFRKYWITSDMSLGQLHTGSRKISAECAIKVNDFSKDPNAQRREIVGDDFDNIR